MVFAGIKNDQEINDLWAYLKQFDANAADGPAGADRRTVGNLVVEARKFSGLAVDTLVELTKDNHTDSTRYSAPRRRFWTAVMDAQRNLWICIFRPMRSPNGSAT